MKKPKPTESNSEHKTQKGGQKTQVGEQVQSMKTDKTESEEHKKLTFMEAKEEMKRTVGNCWFVVVEFGCLKVAMVMAMTMYLSFFLYIKNYKYYIII